MYRTMSNMDKIPIRLDIDSTHPKFFFIKILPNTFRLNSSNHNI